MTAALRGHLSAGGLDLGGVLDAQDYDRLVPPAWRLANIGSQIASVLIVGNAGRGLWTRMRKTPGALAEPDPVDRYVRGLLREACSAEPDEVRAHHHYDDQRDGRFLPLLELARSAGLGTPGRVGVLLHPRFGPWISLRAAIYLRSRHAPSPPLDFDPCPACPAPCATHCHGGAISGEALDGVACFRAKLRIDPCREACAAREACVIGREHAFTREQIAHHSRLRMTPDLRRRARELGEEWPEG